MVQTERSAATRLAHMKEADLLQLAQRGSAVAFQELISRARSSCIRIATVILRNPADAEDEVQNAFWKAYTHLALFNHQSMFSTWLTRIVINHCLMRHRRARKLRFVPFNMTGHGNVSFIVQEPQERETPERALGRVETNDILRDELRKLPALLRIPLEMRYFQDCSVLEVAEGLGISKAAAKSRLNRAQEYLKDRMLRHCGRRGAATLTRVA
jgi:RNA polymerase sigma-70 factor (ECF subfamily)